MKNNFTGMFDALLERPTDHRQVISLSINEDAREAFQSLSGQKVRIKIEKYREKRSLDANAYFVSTVGGAPLDVIKQYIENQKTSQRQKDKLG